MSERGLGTRIVVRGDRHLAGPSAERQARGSSEPGTRAVSFHPTRRSAASHRPGWRAERPPQPDRSRERRAVGTATRSTPRPPAGYCTRSRPTTSPRPQVSWPEELPLHRRDRALDLLAAIQALPPPGDAPHLTASEGPPSHSLSERAAWDGSETRRTAESQWIAQRALRAALARQRQRSRRLSDQPRGTDSGAPGSQMRPESRALRAPDQRVRARTLDFQWRAIGCPGVRRSARAASREDRRSRRRTRRELSFWDLTSHQLAMRARGAHDLGLGTTDRHRQLRETSWCGA